MTTVKVDVDGVIRDIFGAMCRIYNEKFDDNKTLDDIIHYDVDESFPRIKEETGESAAKFFFIDNAHYVFYEGAKVLPGVKEGLLKLHNEGIKVVICTYQLNIDNKVDTLRFLDENGIYYDSLCFTKDKHIVCGDFLIDDCPDFLMHPDEESYTIRMEYPFNKYIDDMTDMSFTNMTDAVEAIINHKNNIE